MVVASVGYAGVDVELGVLVGLLVDLSAGLISNSAVLLCYSVLRPEAENSKGRSYVLFPVIYKGVIPMRNSFTQVFFYSDQTTWCCLKPLFLLFLKTCIRCSRQHAYTFQECWEVCYQAVGLICETLLLLAICWTHCGCRRMNFTLNAFNKKIHITNVQIQPEEIQISFTLDICWFHLKRQTPP